MFRLYRSSQARTAYIETSVPVDTEDAAKIAKAVAVVEQDNRQALSWYYINRGSPKRACQVIGCTQVGLAILVVDGRQMLMESGT